MLLRRYGAADDIAATDRFLAACQHADRAAVEEQLTQDLGLSGRLTAAQQAAAEDSPPGNPHPDWPHPDWPHPDWIAAVQALLEAGASAEDISLSPDAPKPPSPEVAALLRRHGQVS